MQEKYTSESDIMNLARHDILFHQNCQTVAHQIPVFVYSPLEG